jgi:hypothetical protein
VLGNYDLVPPADDGCFVLGLALLMAQQPESMSQQQRHEHDAQ